MPSARPPPANEQYSRFRNGVRDLGLGKQVRYVAYRLEKKAKFGRWTMLKQSQISSKMQQPNVSRAITQLVRAGYVLKRRSKKHGWLCEYRLVDPATLG